MVASGNSAEFKLKGRILLALSRLFFGTARFANNMTSLLVVSLMLDECMRLLHAEKKAKLIGVVWARVPSLQIFLADDGRNDGHGHVLYNHGQIIQEPLSNLVVLKEMKRASFLHNVGLVHHYCVVAKPPEFEFLHGRNGDEDVVAFLKNAKRKREYRIIPIN